MKLCLWPVALGWLIGSLGCDGPVRSGESSSTVFYGRIPESYEVCFYLGEDLESLMPSVVCDRDGETAYSFNIEVTGGADDDGAPCEFRIPWDEPVVVAEDGTFEIEPFQLPGEEAKVSFSGTIVDGDADGRARWKSTENEDTCEILDWTASTGPICREDEEVICDLLLDCCESILLVPPVLEDCLEVVNECDGVICQQVLAGYTQCPQPPICPVADDPTGVCDSLDRCCNIIDVDKEELESCLETAEACEPGPCTTKLITYPECLQ